MKGILQTAMANKIKKERPKGRGQAAGGQNLSGNQKLSQGLTPMHERESKNYSINSDETTSQILTEEELNHFIRSLTYKKIKHFIKAIRGGTKVQKGTRVYK